MERGGLIAPLPARGEEKGRVGLEMEMRGGLGRWIRGLRGWAVRRRRRRSICILMIQDDEGGGRGFGFWV